MSCPSLCTIPTRVNPHSRHPTVVDLPLGHKLGYKSVQGQSLGGGRAASALSAGISSRRRTDVASGSSLFPGCCRQTRRDLTPRLEIETVLLDFIYYLQFKNLKRKAWLRASSNNLVFTALVQVVLFEQTFPILFANAEAKYSWT